MRVYQAGRSTLSIYGSYSHVDGKLLNQASGTVIPDIANFLAKYGFDLSTPLGGAYSSHILSWSAGQVWEGPRSLDATNTFRTKTYSRIDTSLTYTNLDRKGLSAFVSASIYPDNRLEETAFLFSGRVGVTAKAPVTVKGGMFIPL